MALRMALKKSQLYSSLWQSCDELRGGMDASQYKDYVLTLLFVKYVSDKYAADPGALIEVPAGGGFADMAALKGDKEIGDRINKIIGRLAEANDLKGVIDQADFNDESRLGAGKEMQDRLSKLVAIFEGFGAWWQVFPALRSSLFESNGRAGYSEARVETRQVKAAVLGHPEFRSYEARVAAVFDARCETHRARLRALGADVSARQLIRDLSEDLLTRFPELPLLGCYDAYQCLMDRWEETMQDDVCLIAAVGWREAAQPRGIVVDRGKNIREAPDLVVRRAKYKMDLIPPVLVAARWFAAERSAVDALQAEHEAAARELEGFLEEQGGEGGPLEDAADDKGRITRAGVERLRSAMMAERYEAAFGGAGIGAPGASAETGGRGDAIGPGPSRRRWKATRSGRLLRAAGACSRRRTRRPRRSGTPRPRWTNRSWPATRPSPRRRSGRW